MFTFEQLFEAANPNRNPRLKLDVGDTVLVKDFIKTASYEPQKNKNMVGKQGTVVARYPMSQSLKIGVDFGDGKEYKFNSQYLDRVLQPDDAVPVDKRIDILDKAVFKSAGIIEKYDAQKHQQISDNNIAYISAVATALDQASKNMTYTGGAAVLSRVKDKITTNASDLQPVFVVNFPGNLIFPFYAVGVADANYATKNTAMYASALSLLDVSLATGAAVQPDGDYIMVKTGSQGCSIVFYQYKDQFVISALDPMDGNGVSLFKPFSNRHFSHYYMGQTKFDKQLAGTLIKHFMGNSYIFDAKNIANKLQAMVSQMVGIEHTVSATRFKNTIALYIKFIRESIAKQPMFLGQFHGIKAFGPDLILNFDHGKLQSTQQDPSVVMRIAPDAEALLWIDGNEFSENRQPNGVFKFGSNEYFSYTSTNNSFIFTQQTKQQISAKSKQSIVHIIDNTLGGIDKELMKSSVANDAAINVVIFKNADFPQLQQLKFLLPFNEINDRDSIIISQNGLNKMLSGTLNDENLNGLSDAVAMYLQLKNECNWPDSDYICLAVDYTGYGNDNIGYTLFPSDIIQSVEKYNQFKSQMRQDIGDEMADIGDMF
jgi:hypothetical protein